MPPFAVVGNMEDVLQQLEASNKLLKALTQAQSQFIVDANPRTLFDGLLETLLELTQSEYGFIGEIHYTDKSEPQIEAHMKVRGKPYLKTHAITNIAWNESTRNLYEENAPKGMEFYNLKTLFGAVIVTGETVIANNPATDGRRGGLPDGHPPLNAFLGLPLFDRDKQLVGMVGIANRPGGYDELMITYLEPFLVSCSYVIAAHRNDKRRQEAEKKLRESEELFRATFEQAAVGIARVAPDGKFLELNQKFGDIVGYTREEMLLLTFQDITHPEDLNADLDYLRQVLAGEISTYSMEKRYIRKDRSLQWVNLTVSLVREVSGEPKYFISVIEDINARKQAEAGQEQSNNILRSVIESTTDIVFVKDIWGRYVIINSTGCRRLEKPIEEIIGKDDLELFPPELARKIMEADSRIMTTGETLTYEEDVPECGIMRTLLTTKCPWRDAEGTVIGVVSIARDISDRKQAELALQERKQFLASIYDGVEHPIFVVDVLADGDFRFAGMNPAGLRVSSTSIEQLCGKTLEQVYPELIAASMRQHYTDCLKAGTSIAYEERMNLLGVETWWNTTLTPLRDREGRIHRIIGMTLNVTPRKLAEEALQRSEAQFRQLAEREALLNRLANQIRNSLDINTILETTVQEIRSLLELDSCLFIWYLPKGKDAHSKLPAWHVVHEAKKSDLPTLLGYYLTDATKRCLRAIANLEIIRIDDIEAVTNPVERQFFLTLGYKSLLNVPLQTSRGSIGMIACGSCIDWRGWKDDEVELLQAIALQLAIAISQAELYAQTQNSARIAQEKAKQLEVTLQELQQTQTQLIQSEKMSSLGQMVAGIAHEINNPTSFIYSNIEPASEYINYLFNLLELYQKHYPYPAVEIREQIEAIELDFLVKDLHKLLNSMQVGATRIRDIVRSLRTFSRLDESDMKQVDIHEGIDSTLMILEHRLKKVASFCGIEIIKNYGKLPLVECYAGQLNQVFMNILVNAIDALEEVIGNRSFVNVKAQQKSNYQLPITNYQLPKIQISTSVVEANQVLVQIADNGPGMTKEVQRRLFDPFFTTKPVGSGTGLGMSISYQIIEKHGGQLKCISSPGKGAEFSIFLPIKSS